MLVYTKNHVHNFMSTIFNVCMNFNHVHRSTHRYEQCITYNIISYTYTKDIHLCVHFTCISTVCECRREVKTLIICVDTSMMILPRLWPNTLPGSLALERCPCRSVATVLCEYCVRLYVHVHILLQSPDLAVQELKRCVQVKYVLHVHCTCTCTCTWHVCC